MISIFRAQLEKVLDSTPLRLSLFLGFVLLAFSPIFFAPRNGGWTLDWLFFQFYDEVARKTILQYHELPIWNPYFCGGITMIGNPQTTFLVPTFPLVLLFGTTFGQRLSDLPVMVLGCEGMWRLIRYLGMGRSAALLGAVAFPFFGRTFGWMNNGQHGLLGFVLSGWVLYGYLRGLERPVYLALGAAFFAWEVCFRGIETTPELALGLGVWAILEGHRRYVLHRRLTAALWPVLAGLLLGLLALGFSGMRMFPALELLLKHPRIINETRSNLFSEAFVELYALPPGTKGYGAPGYAYVGTMTYWLFLGALLFARARARAALPLLVTLFFMMLTLGMHGTFSPLPWLHRLPLFRSLRNPTLWSFAGAFFLVIAACYALDELGIWLRGRNRLGAWLAAWVLPGLVLLISSGLIRSGYQQLSGQQFPFRAITPPEVLQDFRQTRGNYFEFSQWPYLNRGTLSCYDETPFPASPALRPDLPAEEYLAEPDAGEVKRLHWSPNRIDLAVSLKRPATVLVNQNFAEGWHASVGTVHSYQGLVAVALPAGEHHLTLRMWPRLVSLGVLTMLLSLLATAALVRADRRRRSRDEGTPPATSSAGARPDDR